MDTAMTTKPAPVSTPTNSVIYCEFRDANGGLMVRVFDFTQYANREEYVRFTSHCIKAQIVFTMKPFDLYK